MKDTAPALLPVDANSRVLASPNGHRRYPSLSERKDADLDLQPETESGTASIGHESRQESFDHPRIFGQSAVGEQQAVSFPPAKDEVRVPIFVDDTHDDATLSDPLSPRTAYPESTNATAHIPSSPPSHIGRAGFSPDLWTMSPEERSLMTNSANFARDRRRRRGAIYLNASVELELAPSSWPAPPSPPALPQDLDSSDDGTAGISEILSADDNSGAKPRGRLQRPYTSSKRDGAGVVMVPGLLRRLVRPFSGPWRGPPSPLTPVSLVAAPPVGRLSRLGRLFSHHR